MKVLIVTYNFVKEKDGQLFCIRNLYDILKRFAYLGELHLCAVQHVDQKSANIIDAPLHDLVKKENIYFIAKNRVLLSKSNKEILKKAIGDVDLVIGYVPNISAYYAGFYAQTHGKKYLAYLVADVWDALWNHSLKAKVVAPYFYYRCKVSMKEADYALYVTNRYLQERYPCKGICCGASDVKISPVSESVLEQRCHTIDKLNVDSIINLVTVAAVGVRYKGQEYVIKALGELKKRGSHNYHYYLAGGGDQTFLKNIAKENGVEDQVHFLGVVKHEEIENLLDNCHIYLQPSLQEGLPRSVVEAMSRGLLCIGARTAAIPELLDDKYVIRRKSSCDVVELLSHITKVDLIEQARRNMEQAKFYEEDNLNNIRKDFFNQIIRNCKDN